MTDNLNAQQAEFPPLPNCALQMFAGICDDKPRTYYTADQMREYARAALGQQPAQAEPVVPEGFAIVPLEPNDVQQAAGAQAVRIDTTLLNKMFTANRVYRDMIAAAPVPDQAGKADT